MRTVHRGYVRPAKCGRLDPVPGWTQPAGEAKDGTPRLRRLPGRGDAREAGLTFIEVLVVVPFLIIVTMLVFVTLTSAYVAQSRVQGTDKASSQVTLAFMQLDSEIRYATNIGTPVPDSNSPPDYFVKFELPATQSTQGQPTCTQVEYTSTGNLQQRSWLANASVPTAGWQVMASGLETTPLSTAPFSLSDPAYPTPWQLSMNLTAPSGTKAAAVQSSFTITSLDTTSSATNQNAQFCGSAAL